MIYKDCARINALINHPSIREKTLLGLKEDFDVTPLIESGEALFFGGEGGGFLVSRKGEGVWEVHTQFLPETDRSRIMQLIGESKTFMFTKTDCIALTTFVEYENKPALQLALKAGFKKIGEAQVLDRLGDMLMFTIKDWALCQSQS